VLFYFHLINAGGLRNALSQKTVQWIMRTITCVCMYALYGININHFLYKVTDNRLVRSFCLPASSVFALFY